MTSKFDEFAKACAELVKSVKVTPCSKEFIEQRLNSCVEAIEQILSTQTTDNRCNILHDLKYCVYCGYEKRNNVCYCRMDD